MDLSARLRQPSIEMQKKLAEQTVISLSDQISDTKRINDVIYFKMDGTKHVCDKIRKATRKMRQTLDQKRDQLHIQQTNFNSISENFQNQKAKMNQNILTLENLTHEFQTICQEAKNTKVQETDELNFKDDIPNESLELFIQISELQRRNAILKTKIYGLESESNLNKSILAFKKIQKRELRLKQTELNTRLKRLEERYEQAAMATATPIDSTYDETEIIQTEASTLETEKRFNRSRVQAIEAEAREEYAFLKDLEADNKKRRRANRRRQRKLQKRQQRYERKCQEKEAEENKPQELLIEDSYSEITSSYETRLTSVSSRLRKSSPERRQKKLDKMNADTDAMEDDLEQVKGDTLEEWREKNERINQLTQQLMEIQKEYLSIHNEEIDRDMLQLRYNDLQAQINHLENESAKMRQLTSQKEDELSLLQSENEKLVSEKQSIIQKNQTHLSERRAVVDNKRIENEYMERQIEDIIERESKLAAQLKQTNDTAEDVVLELQNLSAQINTFRMQRRKPQE